MAVNLVCWTYFSISTSIYFSFSSSFSALHPKTKITLPIYSFSISIFILTFFPSISIFIFISLSTSLSISTSISTSIFIEGLQVYRLIVIKSLSHSNQLLLKWYANFSLALLRVQMKYS